MTLELPLDFIHEPPTDDYFYEKVQFKSNVIAIFLVYRPGYLFNGNNPHHTIWGFCKTKTTAKRGTTHTYHAPINKNKVGAEVNIDDTTPFTAMQLNLNPLQAAFA
jgi:hypothetical protein